MDFGVNSVAAAQRRTQARRNGAGQGGRIRRLASATRVSVRVPSCDVVSAEQSESSDWNTDGTAQIRFVGPRQRVEARSGTITIRVNNRRAVSTVLRAPFGSGPARAYAKGDITVESDLRTAVRSSRLASTPGAIPSALSAALRSLIVAGPRGVERDDLEFRRPKFWTSETLAAASRHHYDQAVEFFRIMLGPTMIYSSAMWGEQLNLDGAQERKVNTILDKAVVGPGSRVLDVGCGFGTLLNSACGRGASGVGITHSQVQARYARLNAPASGAQFDEVDLFAAVLPSASFTSIVSVGMYEHIPKSLSGPYFRRIRSLLADGGTFVQQQIFREDDYRSRLRRRGFTERFIFPNGQLKPISTIVADASRAGLSVRGFDAFGADYARTLECWRANIESERDAVVKMIGIEKYRIWLMYLAGAAEKFEQADISVGQLVFS